MNATATVQKLRALFDKSRALDFLAPLLLRVYLAPVFIAAGLTKLLAFDNTVAWFGNPEWGLGLPLPWLMTVLAIGAELIGGLLLLIGLLTRLMAVPLMITMLVAAFAVHWQHGWFAIAPSDPQTSTAMPLAAIGIPAAQHSLDNSEEVGKRLSRARTILQEHGHYDWLTEKGNFVVLNNGIEFAATYFVMLLSLFFTGAGRWFSVDYWLVRSLRKRL